MDYHRKLRSPLDLNSPRTTTKDKYSEKTVSDWVTCPGYRSSRESNMHPKSPDPARVDELAKVNSSILLTTKTLRFVHRLATRRMVRKECL